ncbi:uncharacterized protein LOC104902680 [Beta vulgaris subsp. vulgaris]|uniref:uncharacterized protein LOC104902680 n=1 Tax=Beta vulgaris subsp. vulgaris TaxID=3555 RepID=UPI00053F5DF5|nr:uncharacterized protein LOC104902680 [Beta vulgaris subsp. vulgaris]
MARYDVIVEAETDEEYDDDDVSDDDEEYDEEKEEDKSDSEDVAPDEEANMFSKLMHLAELAPSFDNNAREDYPTMSSIVPHTNPRKEVKTITEATSKVATKKRKGRGPTKGLRVTTPMTLEYDDMGQPCGKWRAKYGQHIGLCMRKLNILTKWKEVPEGMKKALWEDTCDIFHITPDENKKALFLSAVAERFRAFKSKLVSGWITNTRKRTGKKRTTKKAKQNDKVNDGNVGETVKEPEPEKQKEGEEKEVPQPASLPYQIWSHIKPEDWEAFVAENTTPEAVAKREKHVQSSRQKKHYHHMGSLTYERAREKWINEDFYPTIDLSVAPSSSSKAASVKVDRVSDWWCSMHGRDENNKMTISDPGTLKIANDIMGLKQKEVSGDFTPKGNKDAIYETLGKDHNGRLRGVGGLRLGVTKVYGKECSMGIQSRSNISLPHDLEAITQAIREKLTEEIAEKVTQNVTKSLNVVLSQFGLSEIHQPKLDRPLKDKTSEHNTHKSAPFILVLEEETPCQLLLDVKGDGLIVVAEGHAQPQSDRTTVHHEYVDSEHFGVSVDTITPGYEDFALPVPKPTYEIHVLTDARGGYVLWPSAWVKFSDEVLERIKKPKESKADSPPQQKAGSPPQQNADSPPQQKADSPPQQKADSPPQQNADSPPQQKATTISSSPPKKAISVEELQASKGLSLQENKSKENTSKDTWIEKSMLKYLTKACLWLYVNVCDMPDDKPMEVKLGSTQFNYLEDASTWVSKADIKEFLCGEMLNVSLIQVFMRMLQVDLCGRDCIPKQHGWLCPSLIRADNCLVNTAQVKEYISKAVKESRGAKEKFILAPCFENLHWSLLVICYSNYTIYQFDSAAQNPPRPLLLKSCLNSALKKLKRKGTHPRWKAMKCVQQTGGTECGYYVLRLMLDITSSCKEVGDLEKVFLDNKPREGSFTTDEINEVRDLVACYLTDVCM